MDEDKQWFVLERYTKYPMQNLVRFLTAKLTNGAVYEVGMMEKLPKPAYLGVLMRSQQQNQQDNAHATRSRQYHNATSPPRKRQYIIDLDYSGAANAINTAGTLNFVVNFPEKETTDHSRPEIHSTLPGVILPADFQQDPRFQFSGPTYTNAAQTTAGDMEIENEAMETLLRAMTPVTSPRDGAGVEVENSPEQPRRSTRQRSQPLLYRVTKWTAKKRTPSTSS